MEELVNSTPVASQRKFRLHWSCILFILLFLIHLISWSFAPTKSNMIWPRMFGVLFGGLIVSWALGWVGFYLTRRSNLVGNLVFCTWILLTILGNGARNQLDARALRDLKGQIHTDIQTALSELESSECPGCYVATVDGLRNRIKHIDATAKRVSSSRTVTFLTCLSSALRTLDAPMAKYDYISTQTLGAIGQLTAREQIPSLINLVDELDASVKAMMKEYQDSSGVIEKCIANCQLSQSEINHITASYRRGFSPQLATLEVQRELTKELKVFLNFMEVHWSELHTGQGLFDENATPSQTIYTFAEIYQNIERLTEKEQQLQLEGLKKLAASVGQP